MQPIRRTASTMSDWLASTLAALRGIGLVFAFLAMRSGGFEGRRVGLFENAYHRAAAFIAKAVNAPNRSAIWGTCWARQQVFGRINMLAGLTEASQLDPVVIS